MFQAKQVDISGIGPCCADFTVEYALLVKDKFYVAYYNEHHCITVASRAEEETTWQISYPTGEWLADKNRYMHQTEFDSHNYLTLAMDNQGHLHLSGNMHKDKMVWFRSTRPYNIHSLAQGTMTGIREESATYPLFFQGANGELLFRYRDGESGNGDDIYNRWNAAKQRWERLLEQPLLSGSGLRNAYARLPIIGPDRHWHMIWMWRDTPHCETCHDLSYARSPDMINWFTHTGQPCPLPITLERGDIVDPAQIQQGLINMSQNIGFDSQGRVLITWHRYDANGFSQAWIARADHNGWRTRQISNWDFRWDFRGMGSIPPDVILSAPQCKAHTLSVTFQLHDGTCGRWYLDEETLDVIRVDEGPVTPLPDAFYQPDEDAAPGAEVNIVSELYQPEPRHFLRWQALPIQRDVPSGKATGPGKLTLISINA